MHQWSLSGAEEVIERFSEDQCDRNDLGGNLLSRVVVAEPDPASTR